MDELLRIEKLAAKITKESTDILDRNYPLDSRSFLTGEDARKVAMNDDRIYELADMYRDTYMSLSKEEQRKVKYNNFTGTYFQSTHKGKGLISVSQYSDEYELHDAFARATSFGMKALDGLLLGEKNKDEALINTNKRILAACEDVLSVHFWGNSCLQKLDRYNTRIRAGRTVEDDIKEYLELIEEAKKLAYEYARAKLRNASEQTLKEFYQKFNDIFDREKVLIEFIPRDVLFEISVNLHWLKIDAENDPQKVVDEHDKGVSLK